MAHVAYTQHLDGPGTPQSSTAMVSTGSYPCKTGSRDTQVPGARKRARDACESPPPPESRKKLRPTTFPGPTKLPPISAFKQAKRARWRTKRSGPDLVSSMASLPRKRGRGHPRKSDSPESILGVATRLTPEHGRGWPRKLSSPDPAQSKATPDPKRSRPQSRKLDCPGSIRGTDPKRETPWSTRLELDNALETPQPLMTKSYQTPGDSTKKTPALIERSVDSFRDTPVVEGKRSARFPSKNLPPSTLPKPSFQRQPSVEEILKSLPAHTPKLRELFDALNSRAWHNIATIPQAVHDLGLHVPILVPAERCWVDSSGPSLYNDILPAITESDFSAHQDAMAFEIPRYPRALYPKKPRHKLLSDIIFKQLIFDPPKEYPMVAHNIPFEPEADMDTSALPTKPIEGLEHFAVNITPQNTVVDIHIDQGTNGLSLALGRLSVDPESLCAEKIWMLWPPTSRNLGIYETLWKESMKVENAKKPIDTTAYRLLRARELEHGVIARFGVESGIFLPCGWLHATVTLRGGFLGGITFHSCDTISTASRIMAIDCAVHPDRFSSDVDLYLCGLEKYLESEDQEHLRQAALGWVGIDKVLRRAKWKPTYKEYRSAAKNVLDTWLDGDVMKRLNGLRGVACSCGWSGAAFGTHFEKEHLKVMIYPGYRPPL